MGEIRKLKVVLFISLALLCFSGSAYAAWQIKFDSEADRVLHLGGNTLRGNFTTKQQCLSYWKSRPAFERNHSRCVGSDSPSGYGGSGSSEDFAMQMFGSLLGNLFQAALAPPQVDHAYQQQQAMKKKLEKQKALKKQAMEQWKKLRDEEVDRMAREEAEKKKRGKDLLARMQITDTDSPDLYAGMDRIGGKLGPFGSVTPKLEATPIGAGVYDTSGLTSWQRLLCSAYFSGKALDASRGGDPEGARFMNIQSDRVTVGEMTEVECRLPGLQQLADIQLQNLQQNNRMAEMVKLLPVVQEKVKRLQQIELKLHEVKEEKKEAEVKLKEAESKVEEAKVQAESAKTPEEKDEADNLLELALALEDEALTQVAKAEEGKQKYAELREEGREELRGIQEKMNTGSATKLGGR